MSLPIPVAVKNPCPVMSHPTPFSILIIVELVLVLNMHEIFATGGKETNNQSSNKITSIIIFNEAFQGEGPPEKIARLIFYSMCFVFYLI